MSNLGDYAAKSGSIPVQGEDRSVPEILNAAADLLEKPGAWTQGDYQKNGQCFCVIGAVCAVQGFNPPCDETLTEDFNEACRALAFAITGEPQPYMVARWNDVRGRTQSEVVAAVRLAAASARASQPAAEMGETGQ